MQDNLNERGLGRPVREVHLGSFQKFLYLFIAPLVFTVCLTLVLGGSLGIFDFSPQFTRVQLWLHTLPVVGAWIPEPMPPVSEDTAREQIMREIAAQWDLIARQQEILDERAQDITLRERQLNEIAQQIRLAEDQRQSRAQIMAILVEYFETMRPADAADIMNRVQTETAVEIFLAMDIARGARIMQEMDPDRASLVTETIRR